MAMYHNPTVKEIIDASNNLNKFCDNLTENLKSVFGECRYNSVIQTFGNFSSTLAEQRLHKRNDSHSSQRGMFYYLYNDGYSTLASAWTKIPITDYLNERYGLKNKKEDYFVVRKKSSNTLGFISHEVLVQNREYDENWMRYIVAVGSFIDELGNWEDISISSTYVNAAYDELDKFFTKEYEVVDVKTSNDFVKKITSNIKNKYILYENGYPIKFINARGKKKFLPIRVKHGLEATQFDSVKDAEFVMNLIPQYIHFAEDYSNKIEVKTGSEFSFDIKLLSSLNKDDLLPRVRETAEEIREKERKAKESREKFDKDFDKQCKQWHEESEKLSKKIIDNATAKKEALEERLKKYRKFKD